MVRLNPLLYPQLHFRRHSLRNNSPLLRRYLFCLIVFLLLPSCANHYQHYSAFTASDSRGVVRQHRLIWESYHYPAWHWRSDYASPIRLESQCSDRVWLFRDASMKDLPGKGGCRGAGIIACGDPGWDRNAQRQAMDGPGEVCMRLTDDDEARRVLDLGGSARLTVHCYPAGSGDTQGYYPRASVVPYPLRIRRAPADSREWHPPDLDQTACD